MFHPSLGNATRHEISAMKLQQLRSRQTTLEAEICSILSEQNFITGCCIDSAPGGSGAYGGQTTLYRLRWWEGGQKKCRTLKPAEVVSTRAAVEKGLRLTQLRKELEQVQKQLQRGEARAARLREELEKLGA